MESRRRNPLRRYPTAVCISVLHFGLTQSKTRALNSPDRHPKKNCPGDDAVLASGPATRRSGEWQFGPLSLDEELSFCDPMAAPICRNLGKVLGSSG